MTSFARIISAKRRGFSLVELLVVMVLIGILAVGVIPAIRNTSRAYQMTNSTDSLVNGLMLARQTALARGASVQVRFYLLPDYEKPESSSPNVYRAMQCFLEEDPKLAGGKTTFTLTPLGRPVYLKNPIVILDEPTRSTMLTLPPASADRKLGPFNENYKYISFRYRPNGEPDLPITANCLTLVAQNDRVGSNGFPSNFRTVKVELPSGVVKSYAP